jgi:hypothetical protein
MRVIDYDRIEEWSPWLTAMISSTAPSGFLDSLRRLNPEYIEGPRNHVVGAIGRDRLIEELNCELDPYEVRVFHGTRVTNPEISEISQIRTQGLRALKLFDRHAPLIAIFSQHRDWSAAKEALLDEQLHRFGPAGRKRAPPSMGAFKRCSSFFWRQESKTSLTPCADLAQELGAGSLAHESRDNVCVRFRC